MFLTWLDLLPQMQAFEHRLRKRSWACRPAPSHKEQVQKTASHVCWILWLVTEELAGEHRLRKRLWSQRFDLIIRETNSKIVLHISPFFERMPRGSWLNIVYLEKGIVTRRLSQSLFLYLINSFFCSILLLPPWMRNPYQRTIKVIKTAFMTKWIRVIYHYFSSDLNQMAYNMAYSKK